MPDILSRFSVVEPIEEDIKYPIEQVLGHLLEWRGMPVLIGNGLVSTFVLVYVDYLGYLFTADTDWKQSSANAVKFMKEYFRIVDERYNKVSGLLYTILRNGLIHRTIAKTLKLPSGKLIGVMWTSSSDRKQHLKILISNDGYLLNISPKLLFQDMRSAIDLYCADYQSKASIKHNYAVALNNLGKPQAIVNAKGKYILGLTDSDVAYVTANASHSQ